MRGNIYRCIECKKILDESYIDKKTGNYSLTCGCDKHKREDQIFHWSLNAKYNEVRNFNYVIDEYSVRKDLDKNSFIYQQLYLDR